MQKLISNFKNKAFKQTINTKIKKLVYLKGLLNNNKKKKSIFYIIDNIYKKFLKFYNIVVLKYINIKKKVELNVSLLSI